MDKDRKQMVERILNLTLEIIHLLTGEDYIVVKKISEEGEGWSRNQDLITLSPPHSLIHERNRYQEILDLTNKMAELLTGEITIRFQDDNDYFSMEEEWGYLESHKDQLQDILKEKHKILTSPDVFIKKEAPERCPLYPGNCPEENPDHPQDHEATDVKDMKVEVLTEEESYVNVMQPCKEGEIPTDITADDCTKNLEENLPSPPVEVCVTRMPKRKEINNDQVCVTRMPRRKEISNDQVCATRMPRRKEISNDQVCATRMPRRKEISNDQVCVTKMPRRKEISNDQLCVTKMPRRKEISNDQVCVTKMPRRKEISNDLREAIVAAHQSGKGYKAISKQFEVHHSTVRKIIHKWKTFKTVGNLPRSGRPSKFTPSLDRAMFREIVKNPRATYKTLQASVSMLNIQVHHSTIRKRLNKYSLLAKQLTKDSSF
ncbi:uncharacterized protein RB166_019314 isoform 2-T2 [Leptodactylus fuscus]|uniref:uncharacterized protein LOC142186404 isoform X2 n=1 Tax=Leptodactylus fuscus TaxID=238119 RepID=UPI003F4E9051